MSPRKLYEMELDRLQESVTEIGISVQALYVRLFSALEQDKEDEIVEIMKSDRDVHGMQRNIEGSCLNLITKQQPVARDLRQVSASLKAVTDIGRMGDMCVDIAELLLRMKKKDLTIFSKHLPQMISETKRQMAEAVDAFSGRDVTAANRVVEGDDVIDNLFNLVKADLIDHLKDERQDPDDCVDVLMIAKHLEKIGDHAVNMAEWAIFRETGKMRNVLLL